MPEAFAMTIEIILDDADVTIDVHPGQRLVRLAWKRAVPGPVYREVLLTLLEVVRQRNLKLWLSDGRRMGPILYDDQVWTMKEYTPQVLQAGLERIAIVNSEDVMNQLAVDRMVNATPADAPYEIAFFQDPAIGQLWLMDPRRSGPKVETPKEEQRS
ncbi:MAG: hypothetical protein JNM31_04370 [Flavobacteriales bacterium]|nr:hypothetical protein [Flavobacteriales bacterium]